MIRSMYSGISGMKNFQTKLDVIGNNIANVNTYGFKKGRVTFKDMVNQTISGASGPSQGKGGINPKQVGLGSQLAAIDTIDTQGSLQTTGRVLDLAIQGDGYLVVSEGTGAASSTFYTRAGNIYLNNDGYLVTSGGQYVMATNGANPPVMSRIQLNNGNINEIKNLSISEDGKITFIKAQVNGENLGADYHRDGDLVISNISIALARFSNPGGLEKVGENMYINTANSGAATNMVPGSNGVGSLISGALEMSNVDLSEEFTEMIVAQRGFQANTRIITTSDEILQELVNLKR
ncbi:flagellar basal body rod protein FlgG [Lederbergia citrea]|uniref:Flagellar hook protein FlgE n=1 Tax=Lederbergia citrea TaxID=2833581 RepID=A0A942UMH5_9BACI|nr:flagellar basal body rod protein FlgG [Lederbergia citrea]MBS4177116.1 flagellar basal body rod protein FlgG [Lederbergia citrea]MBS4203779.1 flagellar basal body rod protein FlgG [Lederbergia citrea]MBS4221636.1 flagellar basal body rod protein FlgG [Lederbergia citrea]